MAVFTAIATAISTAIVSMGFGATFITGTLTIAGSLHLLKA